MSRRAATRILIILQNKKLQFICILNKIFKIYRYVVNSVQNIVLTIVLIKAKKKKEKVSDTYIVLTLRVHIYN